MAPVALSLLEAHRVKWYGADGIEILGVGDPLGTSAEYSTSLCYIFVLCRWQQGNNRTSPYRLVINYFLQRKLLGPKLFYSVVPVQS